MVAIKAADKKLVPRDIWPGLPWTWKDTARIKAECYQKALDKGHDGIAAQFKASNEWMDYLNSFPSYSQQQQIMKQIYPPAKPNPSLNLTEEELDYLLEKLHGINDPIGQDILRKIQTALK
jgi:hypothetical protein